MVDTIMSDYAYCVKDKKTYESLDFVKWGEESYELAITLYEGVEAGKEVPKAYLEKNVPIANERITLGGYRLYYIIDYMFSKKKHTE